jgi:hypothetical protein
MSKQLPFPIKSTCRHGHKLDRARLKQKKKKLPFLVAMKQAIEPETGNFRPCALSHFFKPPAG